MIGEDGDRMLEQIKIIGHRQPATGFEQAAAFLDTVIALRGNRPFIPKGYYRFKTFEEAQDWSIHMMARAGRRMEEDRRLWTVGRGQKRTADGNVQHPI